MRTIKIYTFKGEPNKLVRTSNPNVKFRFDNKGKLEVFENDIYIKRLQKRFEHTFKEYNLNVKRAEKSAPSSKKEVK